MIIQSRLALTVGQKYYPVTLKSETANTYICDLIWKCFNRSLESWSWSEATKTWPSQFVEMRYPKNIKQHFISKVHSLQEMVLKTFREADTKEAATTPASKRSRHKHCHVFVHAQMSYIYWAKKVQERSFIWFVYTMMPHLGIVYAIVVKSEKEF